jgi:hypothetical protein
MVISMGEMAESPSEGLVERLLASRRLVGTRRWAMAMLHYRIGLKHEEIGKLFGLSRQSVCNRLNRALRKVERAEHNCSLGGQGFAALDSARRDKPGLVPEADSVPRRHKLGHR